MFAEPEAAALDVQESLERDNDQIEPDRDASGLFVMSDIGRLEKGRIGAEVHHEQIGGVRELVDVVRIGEMIDRHEPTEPQFFDERCEHVPQDRVDPEVADLGERRDDERVGNERQDVTRVVRRPEARLDRVGRWARTTRGRERGKQRVDERRADLPVERHLFELEVGEAPRGMLRRECGALDGVVEAVEVVRDLLCAVVHGGDAGVIAVVSGDAAFERLDRPAVQAHAAAEVRVDVPAQQHLFVEPIDGEEVVAEHELEVARRIEADPLVTQGRLVEVQGWAETLDLGQRSQGVRPWQTFPDPFRELEAGQAVVPIGEVAAHLAQAFAVERNQNHVGVRREQPPVRRFGATRRCVPNHRLGHGQMGAPAVALGMHSGGHAQDA